MGKYDEFDVEMLTNYANYICKYVDIVEEFKVWEDGGISMEEVILPI